MKFRANDALALLGGRARRGAHAARDGASPRGAHAAQPTNHATKAAACALAVMLLVAALAFCHLISAHADDAPSSSVPAIQPSQISLNETASYEKGEVVYSTLDARGNVVASYVVNQFDIKVPGRIVDYGAYQVVKNLSTEAALARQDGATVFDATDRGVFYYEGDSTAIELPWNVSIEYWLDGERYADPAELGGKSGALEIRLRTTQNPSVNSAFFDSFLQQVTFTLSGDLCTNIEADGGATIASAGKDRTIAFTALPGHGADCTVRADVRDFTMDGIQIAALPYESAISMPDTSSVTSGFQQLVDAVALLKGGAADLSSGASQLAYGTSQLSAGLAQFDTAQLEEYIDLVMELIDFIPGVAEDLDLTEERLHDIAQTLNNLAGFLEAIEALDDETRAILEQLLEAYGLSIDPETMIPVLRSLANVLDENAADLVRLMDELADPSQIEGIRTQVKALSEGVVELKDGVEQLSDGANQLAGGMQSYSDGMAELYSGVSALPGTVASEIEKMTAEFSFPEFVPQSFMSAKNTQMKSVQFVIQSAEIELPKAPAADDDQDEKELGFFDRLLALFR